MHYAGGCDRLYLNSIFKIVTITSVIYFLLMCFELFEKSVSLFMQVRFKGIIVVKNIVVFFYYSFRYGDA